MNPDAAWSPLFDVLPDSACILDGDGRIVAVNSAWSEFGASNGGAPGGSGAGTDYLAACDTLAETLSDSEPAAMSVGSIVTVVGDVLAGRSDGAACEYACHSPVERRWFLMRAAAFDTEAGRRVLVTHTDITHSRQDSESHLDHHELFEELSRQPGVGLWQFDPVSGEIVHAESLLKLLGYPSTLRGRLPLRWRHLVARGHRRQLMEWYRMARPGVGDEHAHTGEICLRHHDGRNVWVLLVARIVRWRRDGRPARVVGLALDITSRKRLQAMLAEERLRYQRLSLIASNTDSMVIFTDRDGLATWVNQAFTRKTGYTLEDLRGRTPGQVLQGPDTDPVTVRLMATALAAGQPLNTELLNYTREGRPYRVAIEVKPLRDAAGALTGFMAVQRDITEQHETTLELRRLYDQLHTLTEMLPGGLFQYRIDPLGRHSLDYASARYRELHGLPPGSGPLDVLESLRPIPDDDVAMLYRKVDEALETLSTSHFEYRVRLAGGGVRHIAGVSRPVRQADGSVVLHGFIRDVTDRVLTRRRLQETEARLERAVRGSTDGLWDYDFATRRVWLSDRMYRLLDMTPGEFVGSRPLSVLLRRLHPGQHDALRTAWQAHRDGGHGFDLVVKLRVGDVVYRWFRVRGELTRDACGHAERMSGALTDVHEWQETRESLEWQVLHDPLTGLSNRALFVDRIGQLLRQGRGEARYQSAVFAMDFDRFKQVNDVHGHAAGDELLRAIAERLRLATGPEDLACRFGGDEFAVLLGCVGSVEEVRARAESLHAELARPHYLGNGQEVICTASIGVLYFAAGRYEQAEAVLRDADAAMYQAKASGGRVRFFDRRLREHMAAMAELEHGLRGCIDNGELQLEYQPIVALESGRIDAVEALVRWQRSGSDQPLSANEFVPLAEETGLIVPLGRWIAEQACRDLVALRASHGNAAQVVMAVNVSRRELVEPDYVDWMQATVAKHGLAPADLILEITETAFVDSRFDIVGTARALRDAGFVLALDDFGTGQSSLNSLQELPIVVVKVDKKFIRGLATRQSVIAIVHAIVTLGHYLGLRIVAEGVESATEVAALQGMDCAMGQGYLFTRPLGLQQLLPLLETGVGGAGLLAITGEAEVSDPVSGLEGEEQQHATG